MKRGLKRKLMMAAASIAISSPSFGFGFPNPTDAMEKYANDEYQLGAICVGYASKSDLPNAEFIKPIFEEAYPLQEREERREAGLAAVSLGIKLSIIQRQDVIDYCYSILERRVELRELQQQSKDIIAEFKKEEPNADVILNGSTE